VQALVALANGLDLSSTNITPDVLKNYYIDANAIPDYAVDPVAAATEAKLVVNYPNVQQLNPQAPLTRAEAAAILYQALVQSGQAEPIASNEIAASYIVGSGMGGPSPTTANNNIVAVASANDSFSTLTDALQETGLAKELQSQGLYTVFAPTDEAFAALPEGTLDRLMQPENREVLVKILRYHVVPSAVTSS
jgi:uncharacterized surface protein with fasciclin (FAS1) repeats